MPEPLQPRFYDNDPNVVASVSAESGVVETPQPLRRAPETAAEDQPALESKARDASSTEGSAGPRTPRRRRSRGRRGGSRQRPAAGSGSAETAEEPPSAGESSATLKASSVDRAVDGGNPGAIDAALLPDEADGAQGLPPHSRPTPAASAQAAPVPSRASKGTVVLAIGLPGSGKSSWFKRHNIHPLSSDLLRELLFDDAQEQRFQDLVFSNLRSMLKARLIARRPLNYVDATNLTPHDRHSWIKLAKDYGYDVQGLFFDVPLEVCMERHQRRGRAIPEDVMRKMAGKLKAPTFEEGFSKITVVRVKQKEASAS